ncbi:MAG TPA: carboxylating nicotinate-nucleotide diphosphorylase [Saprospiraceae bacterium]|nr:carboxylating nicotinate-nucleotide diphosphorylase [Saprospiraceae bacterium]HMP24781.1 carboxylating nicotinate-nucleotide diphosphorylase [Saprospiraceae bacterium]
MTTSPHTEALLTDFIARALQEDVGLGDHTSLACISADSRNRAKLLVKDPGIIAGIEVARRIFQQADPEANFQAHLEDGAAVSYGDIAFEVECNTRALLLAERLCLNTMQRMSGIATLSNRFHFEVEDLPVKILDTRKTTPLIRFLEKWAVRLGGCNNYRDGLYDWFMIKDNHIEACGGIAQAIERVHQYRIEKELEHLGVTVEVRNLVELYEALEAGHITRIMLDNFEIPLLKEAVAIVNQRFETEASGGITIHNVRKVALTGVDYISVGALTHSATSLDLSLKIV